MENNRILLLESGGSSPILWVTGVRRIEITYERGPIRDGSQATYSETTMFDHIMSGHVVQTSIALPKIKDSELFRRAIELRDAIDQFPDGLAFNPLDTPQMHATLDLLEAELVRRGLGDLYVRSLITEPQHKSEAARTPSA